MELTDIINLGADGLLLYLLLTEKKDRQAMTERIFRYLEEARDKRHQMAQALAAARLGAEHDQEQKGGD